MVKESVFQTEYASSILVSGSWSVGAKGRSEHYPLGDTHRLLQTTKETHVPDDEATRRERILREEAERNKRAAEEEAAKVERQRGNKKDK